MDKNQLYKISKIPLSRFDQESSETWFGADASSTARTEIDFARFVNRLRNQFAQIIIKPLQLQLALSVPELQENRQFLEAVSLQYKSYNLFEEMMELDLMQKRVEHIQTMKDSMVDMDVEGNEIKFFSSEFLVKKYLKLSDADLKLNEKLKQEEIDKLNLAGGEGSEEGQEPDDNSFESVNTDKLVDLIVERLENKLILTEEISKKNEEMGKSKGKKKKPVKSKENELITDEECKEEE